MRVFSRAHTATYEIDEIYDAIDLDNSNNLDLREMRIALKRFKEEVAAVSVKLEAVHAWAAELRAVAEVVRAASTDTAAYEAAENELMQLKLGTVASRLGTLLMSRRVKVRRCHVSLH